jgi:hypothetical protein
MASTSAKVSRDGIFLPLRSSVVDFERLRGDIGSQHLGQLVILKTAFEEFLLSEAAVVVFVHPGIEEGNLSALKKRQCCQL